MSRYENPPERQMEIKLRAGSKISNLEQMRVARGMTQRQLSKKSGVTIYTIQGFEGFRRDINNAGLDRLLDLCIALDCPIENILEGSAITNKVQMVRTLSTTENSFATTYSYPQKLLNDILLDEELVTTCVDSENTLEYLFQQLPENWGAFLKLRYKDKKTLQAIGDEYQVTKARVGQVIEFALNKLREPQHIECLLMGVTAYQQHCKNVAYQKSIQKANRRLSEVPIDELKLPGRAYNCLMKAGFDTVGKVAELDFNMLCALKNMGESAAQEVLQKIQAYVERRNSAEF